MTPTPLLHATLRRLALPLAIPLLLALGCGADEEAGLLGAGDIPDGYGGLQMAVELPDTLRDDLSGRLRVFEEPTDFTSPLVERSFVPRSGRTLEIVYLEPGSYALEVDLLDGEGLSVMTGLAQGVEVIAGQLTPVSVLLTAAGGVHVDVEIESGGQRFDAPTLLDDSKTWGTFRGTQRVEDGQMWYYGLGRTGRRQNHTYWAMRAETPEALPATAQRATGFGSRGLDLSTLATAGDYLYVVARDALYRSLDGADWAAFGQVPREVRSYEGFYDSIFQCTLFIDTQFNLLCTAAAVYDGPWARSMRYGLVSSYSLDGLTWSPMIPYLSDQPTNERRVDFGTVFGTRGLTAWPSTQPIYLYNTFQRGGFFTSWLGVLRGATDETGESAYSFRVYRVTSTDRQSWTHPDVFADSEGTSAALQIPESARAGAVFDTPDGLRLVYRNRESTYGGSLFIAYEAD